jgi:DNA polymerase III subunit epsilon
MREVPENYLRWAARQSFDEDLLFSLRSELKARKRSNRPSGGHNPFDVL